MFALHETTQRRVCRFTFMMLCVVPTLATLAAIAYCNRPWRTADWQRTLAQQLHVRATLDDVTRPRPGVIVLADMQLSDLLTGDALGSIDRLDLRSAQSRQVLHADRLSLQSAHLPSLAKAISAWLATSEGEPLEFRTDNLTIASEAHGPLEFHNLLIRSDSPSAERRRFRVMARTASDKVLELAVDYESGVLRCAFDTQQASLPAWLIGKLAPGLGGCGDAGFSGSITAECVEQRVRGNLVGVFENVDLQSWIGPDCPHRLRGTAQVELELCTWADRRLEMVRGTIKSGGGAGSHSLLLNAKDLCACVPGAEWKPFQPTDANKLVAFDELALNFDMTQTGIRFDGACENGGLVSTAGSPLLFAPPEGSKALPLPVAQLVQLFDYRRQPGWLPATREAVNMAEKLPLPEQPKRK